MKYRKNSIEARLDALLPNWDKFDIIRHELWGESEGGWSVNSSSYMARGADREETISHLANRWEIFKLNYLPKARAKNIIDIGDGDLVCLEVDCTAFCDVRKSN